MKNFYKNKRVIVTGHSGFKGAWLALWLKYMDCKVLGISNKNFNNSKHFKDLKLKIKSKYFDIREKNKIKNTISLFKPDIIFHLAAQSLVKKGYDDTSNTFDINVNGTLNIFEAVKNIKKKVVIINVTTDKCYKNKSQKKPFKETDELGGDDPYSSSKVISEFLTSSYQRIFKNKNIHIASARCGNVIGGGDWSQDRIIPDIVKSIKKKQKLKIRGFNNVRPWIHVLDSLNGYLILAKEIYNRPHLIGAYNFSPKNFLLKFNVGKIVNEFTKKWKKVNYQKVNRSFFEHKNIFLDSSKSQVKLKWSPKYKTKEAINKTIEWYKEDFNKNKNISKKQLIEYLK